MVNFKSVPELLKHFSNERVCWDYLEQRLWKGQPVCPHCQSATVYRLENYKQFKCGNKKTCDRKFTVLVGSVFENTKLPLQKWILAIHLCTANKKGISSLQLSRHLGITQKSAWHMLHRIRQMITPKINRRLKDKIMIDETYCGGRERFKSKSKKRELAEGKRKIEKTPVLGLLEEDVIGRLIVIKEASNEVVMPVIHSNVELDSLIVTDCSSIYAPLRNDFKYKGHIAINHSQGEYVNGDYTTNPIESMFACLKRTIYGTYHQISVKHLQKYCNETMYRFNTRKLKDFERFDYNFISITGQLKYKDLIKKQ